MSQPLRIALVGGGVVGGGIINILESKKLAFQRLTGREIVVSAICVRDKAKKRDFDIPQGTRVVDDVSDVIDDPNIDLICEVSGAATAKEFLLKAISNGKHVVTAHKQFVANELPSIQEALRQNPNVSFGLEAAVCGGIPIIRTFHTGFIADTLTQIAGIMNGTTNYMLSKMHDEGADYGAVLKEAQQLGYAEADPTADVGGFDVQAKLAILVKLGFGLTVPPSKIPTIGMQQVTKDDFAYAHMLKGTIKLLGVAKRGEDGKSLSVVVSPFFVPGGNVIHDVNGVANVVQVYSESLSETSLVGPGAGRFPTAHSCVSDILAIAQNSCSKPFARECTDLHLEADFEAKFYIRLYVTDGLGIIGAVAQACEKNHISIHSILQTPIVDPKHVPFVLITERCTLKAVHAAVDVMKAYPWVIDSPFCMPFYGH